MLRFLSTARRDGTIPHHRARPRAAGVRGASPLWSVLLVTACAAFLGVTVITYWVTVRGGYVDKPAPAQTGIARVARAAVGHPEPSGAAPDAGAPSGAPLASAGPSAAPAADPTTAPVGANEGPNSGDLDDDEPSNPPTVAGHPAPAAPKTTSKKRRVRPRLKRR